MCIGSLLVVFVRLQKLDALRFVLRKLPERREVGLALQVEAERCAFIDRLDFAVVIKLPFPEGFDRLWFRIPGAYRARKCAPICPSLELWSREFFLAQSEKLA